MQTQVTVVMEDDITDSESSPKAGRVHRQLGKAPGLLKLVNREGSDRKGLPSLRSLSVSLGIQPRKSAPDVVGVHNPAMAYECLDHGSVDIRTMSASSGDVSSADSPCSPTGITGCRGIEGPVVSIRNCGSLEHLGTGETTECEKSTSTPNLASGMKSPRAGRAVSLHMSKSVSAIAATATNWSVKYKRGTSQRDVRRKSLSTARAKLSVSTRNWIPSEPCWRPPMIEDFGEIHMAPQSASPNSETENTTDVEIDAEEN